MEKFELISDFKAAGDQPRAIQELTEGLKSGSKDQVLLGVTGSGKTFTVARMLENVQRPALVISPNKVLAAQLYAEFKSFFPRNAVEYFISYYDYYQPEAYVPQTDTYIEKDASINDHIDKLRLKATTSLLSRRDVILVASVSCIYNIGSPENFKGSLVHLQVGAPCTRAGLTGDLVKIYYERNEVEFSRGKFRVKGNVIDVYPSDSDDAVRVTLDGDHVAALQRLHPLTGRAQGDLRDAWISPGKHFVTSKPDLERALVAIEAELQERTAWFRSHNKPLEAERIEQRTRYDMEMLRETGFCHGIENYSRHLSGRPPGERPYCLLDYFPDDYVVIIDESHVTVPQIGGMYEGDRVRKQTLVDFGFRLPSALDNRPLKFNEFESLVPQTVYVSATPRPYELKAAKGVVVEQVIRPTGLVDPPVIVHPSDGQIPDLIERIEKRVAKKERALVTTLTKRTAEDLAAYLQGKGLKVRYLHSDIDSLTRVDILKDLRKGAFDVLVGINLLREGLDLPEVSLVAILDADNEGFLRSETTLIQIAGRAARHLGGEVVLYADKSTGSMSRALGEMTRRRVKQEAYNAEHGITPRTIVKAVQELEEFQVMAKRDGLAEMVRDATSKPLSKKNLPHLLSELERQMKEAAENLDFELAAVLRDQIYELRDMSGVRPKPSGRKAARALLLAASLAWPARGRAQLAGSVSLGAVKDVAVAGTQVWGEDGAYSIPSDKGSLWLFGDTFFGGEKSDGTADVVGALDNSAAWFPGRDPSRLTTGIPRLRAGRGSPVPVLAHEASEDPKKLKLWPAHGIAVGGKFYDYYALVAITGEGAFDFEHLGQGLAESADPSKPLRRLKTAGRYEFWSASQPAYGAAVLRDADGWLYVYGRATQKPFALTLARVHPERLTHPKDYSYFTDDAEPRTWSAQADRAATLFTAAPAEFSVSFNAYLQRYLMVYVPLSGKNVVARLARYPWGPWGGAHELYHCAPTKPGGFCYAGFEHPEYAAGGGKTVFFTLVEDGPAFTAMPKLYSVDLDKGVLLAGGPP